MAFTNRCGGTRWDMLPDGLIEVEGEGVPAFEPGSARFEQMVATWENWRGLILDAAADNGLPPQWILAIMCQETGPWSNDPARQASIVAPDGGVGLMQITDPSLGDPHAMLDPHGQQHADLGVAPTPLRQFDQFIVIQEHDRLPDLGHHADCLRDRLDSLTVDVRDPAPYLDQDGPVPRVPHEALGALRSERQARLRRIDVADHNLGQHWLAHGPSLGPTKPRRASPSPHRTGA